MCLICNYELREVKVESGNACCHLSRPTSHLAVVPNSHLTVANVGLAWEARESRDTTLNQAVDGNIDTPCESNAARSLVTDNHPPCLAIRWRLQQTVLISLPGYSD